MLFSSANNLNEKDITFVSIVFTTALNHYEEFNCKICDYIHSKAICFEEHISAAKTNSKFLLGKNNGLVLKLLRTPSPGQQGCYPSNSSRNR